MSRRKSKAEVLEVQFVECDEHPLRPLATVADWERRFSDFVRAWPHDPRGIWALIVECLEDDDALSHTCNAVLKAHGAPHNWREDLGQDLALRLFQTIGVRPNLNLDHRRTEVPAAAWIYSVIDKLCAEVVRTKRRKERSKEGLEWTLADDDEPDATGLPKTGQREQFHAAREAQRARERAVDAVLDLRTVLAGFDDWTRALMVAYLADLRVRSVASELDLPYATAWRAVQDLEAKLRKQLCAYRVDTGDSGIPRPEAKFSRKANKCSR